MGLEDKLRYLFILYSKNRMEIFKIKKCIQENYLKRFSEPKDDIERSYYQYKCQMKFKSFFVRFILNIVSLPLVIYYLNKLYVKQCATIKKSKEAKKKTAVFSCKGIYNVIPDTIVKNYKILRVDFRDGLLLKQDVQYIKTILKKYRLSVFFILKIILKISKYRKIIQSYSPEAIIVCAEYNSESSILTDYCEKNGIKHINVMHGEKLYFIRDSFFRFSECYVWNDYYVQLFKKLRAENNQFKIELPKSMCFNNTYKKTVDFTYYLMSEKTDELKRINKILCQLKHKYLAEVFVRPHPIYSNIRQVNKIFTNIQIENNKDITIEESIMRTKNVIALYSTVLNQAHNNGVNIIIDDMTQKYQYEKLKDLEYIMLSHEFNKLSDLLK